MASPTTRLSKPRTGFRIRDLHFHVENKENTSKTSGAVAEIVTTVESSVASSATS